LHLITQRWSAKWKYVTQPMNSLLAPTISARYLQRNAGPRTYWLLYNGRLVKVASLWRCFSTNKSLNCNHDRRLSRLKQEPLHSILECWHGPLQFRRSVLATKPCWGVLYRRSYST